MISSMLRDQYSSIILVAVLDISWAWVSVINNWSEKILTHQVKLCVKACDLLILNSIDSLGWIEFVGCDYNRQMMWGEVAQIQHIVSFVFGILVAMGTLGVQILIDK